MEAARSYNISLDLKGYLVIEMKRQKFLVLKQQLSSLMLKYI